MPTNTPLYVQRLILKDIRCFTHLELDFRPGESIVVIGDNGDGKSTVLRSLAMGICDQSSASALFRELYGEYVRKGSRNDYGTIEIELAARGSHRERYRIRTIIRSLKRFERVEQHVFRLTGNLTKELDQDSFPWHRIFATGYGPGIRVQGTSDFDDYLAVDAVYPLFRYDVLLQNPELAVRRIIDAAGRARGTKGSDDALAQIQRLLARVLQLNAPEDISLESRGIFIRSSSGMVSLSAAADGFRATLTWVLDLLAWWFVHGRARRTTAFLDVHGIVFIDEVEQHLHPRWQRNIMPLLTASFPHAQFIATTHSPLVASGCEGIPVHSLANGDHSIQHPYGWLAEDVYRMMGLDEGSRSMSFHRDVLRKARELDLKRLHGRATRAELAKLRDLEQRLRKLPPADPVLAVLRLKNIGRFLQPSRSRKKGSPLAKR